MKRNVLISENKKEKVFLLGNFIAILISVVKNKDCVEKINLERGLKWLKMGLVMSN